MHMNVLHIYMYIGDKLISVFKFHEKNIAEGKMDGKFL